MISEIKKWAKSHEYEVKNCKENGGYTWRHLNEKETSFAKDLDTLAKDIFNPLTKDKWKAHQEDFQNRQSRKKT